MKRSLTQTVKFWHDALNAGDLNRLLALSTTDIEVGGPRGSGRGSSILADWVGRTGITLAPQQYFARGPLVVVEQEARWHVSGGDDSADPQKVASVFAVREG